VDLEALIALLRQAPGDTALFTDFDGTLSPIVPDPSAARPVPGAVDALVRLVARYRRVAVLSGRPLSYLQPLLPEAIDIGALYGLEQRVAGRPVQHPEAERWQPVVAALVAEAVGALTEHPGVQVEPKGLSLTVHFRNAPAAEAAVASWAADAARRSGLRAQPAKASIELHPPVAVDKGTLLSAWAAGAAVVAYFGDDLGDLPAFTALRQLRGQPGTRTVAVVAAGPETPDAVRRAADVLLDGPAEVAAVFQRLAAAS
jgi:trehalose 6-phosphate phosphatase